MDNLLHANLVHSLIDDIITEHTEISFIIKGYLEVTISARSNIIPSYRIHNNLHGCIWSRFNKHINTQIHGRTIILLLLSSICKMIEFCPDTILQTFRSLIDKSNKLIAGRFRSQARNISKGCISSGC